MNIDPETATRQELEQALTHWRSVKESRLAQQKIADKLKEQEDALRHAIVATMQHQLYDGMVVGERVMGLTSKTVPIVGDAAALSKHILDTGRLELLQFRLSTTAIAEYEAAGEVIPGLDHIEQFNLYDRKVK